MPSLLSGNSSACQCSSRFLKRALFLFCLAGTLAAQQKPAPQNTSAHRANEFTLAGLRPGKDVTARAVQLFKKADSQANSEGEQLSWTDICRHERLVLDLDAERVVQVIRVTWLPEFEPTTCEPPPGPSSWKTGLGLRIYDTEQKVIQLYGQPDSRSPSTRDGQPLELMYYAFDWAGPDVPQVMEVLCTREKDGQPGRVVEITLAAPSL